MSRHNKTMSRQKMENLIDKSSYVSHDKGFDIVTNILENDKFKA